MPLPKSLFAVSCVLFLIASSFTNYTLLFFLSPNDICMIGKYLDNLLLTQNFPYFSRELPQIERLLNKAIATPFQYLIGLFVDAVSA